MMGLTFEQVSLRILLLVIEAEQHSHNVPYKRAQLKDKIVLLKGTAVGMAALFERLQASLVPETERDKLDKVTPFIVAISAYKRREAFEQTKKLQRRK